MYFVLLRHGEATVNEISDAADISVRYVYEIAERLADRGVLKVNDHESPTTIRAVPPDEAIDGIVSDLNEVGDELRDLYNAPGPQKVEFDLIESLQTARKRVQTILSGAAEEVVLAIPGTRLSAFAAELEEAAERGVTVLLLVEENRANPTYELVEHPRIVVRVWDGPLPLMAAADVETGVIGPAESLTSNDADRSIVMVRQPQLVGTIVGSFLSNYWPPAEEVYVPDPSPLPQTFTHFRSAVLEAALRLNAGDAITATAEVHSLNVDWPEDDDTVSGEVVEVRQGLVKPTTNTFPVEASLVVETDRGRVTVGGEGALLEDLEAEAVTLSLLET